MHISEGVLSPAVLGAGAALTACGVYMGLSRLSNKRVPEVAVLASAFFVASLIRIPAGPLPTSIHLTIGGLMGLALGWAAFPAILVGLSLQALMFQFGGISTLGVNTAIMATPAVAVHYMFGPLLRRRGSRLAHLVGGFGAGAIAAALSAVLMASALMATGQEYAEIGGVIVGVNVITALVEGIVTAFIVSFILKVKPEILLHSKGRG